MDLNLTRPSEASQEMREVMSSPVEVDNFNSWSTQEGARLIKGLESKMHYDQQRAVLRLPASDALKTTLASAWSKDPALDSSEADWETVVERIDNVRKSYDDETERNKFRSYIRDGKEVCNVLANLVDVIPDEKGLSILKAGLSFVFQAWEQRIANRQKILQVLSDVPDMLAYATEKSMVHQRDATLKVRVRAYCTVILDSITELANILLRTHQGKLWNRMRKQLPSKEAESIETQIINIEACKQKVVARVETLDQLRQKTTEKNTEEGLREAKAIRVTVNSNSNKISDVSKQAAKIEIGVQRVLRGGEVLSNQINNTEANLTRRLKENKADVDRSIEMGNESLFRLFQPILTEFELVKTALYRLTAENTVQRQRLQAQSKKRAQERPPIHRTMSITPAGLLGLLNIDPLQAVKDAEAVSKHKNSIRPDALAKARWLSSTSQFRNWVSDQQFSRLLLVDGFCAPEGIGRTSPLSVFSASLAAMLSQIPSTVVLHFYCGRYAGLRNRSGGPTELMRSLIGQLIRHPGKSYPDLNFVDQELYDAVAARDIVGLCYLFEQIVQRTDPSLTIYCIIDNISDFERSFIDWDQPRGAEEDGVQDADWGAQIMEVFNQIRSLVDDPRDGPPVKALLTSATRTAHLLDHVDRESGECVSLVAGTTSSRPFQGRALAEDIRRMTNTPPPGNQNRSLRPGAPRQTRSGLEYDLEMRPRSSGSNMPSDW